MKLGLWGSNSRGGETRLRGSISSGGGDETWLTGEYFQRGGEIKLGLQESISRGDR